MQRAVARKRHWTLDDIPWAQFDAAQVDPDILKVVKAAAMVEHNGGDYAAYLCSVFHDDPEFQVAARQWAEEEVQHQGSPSLSILPGGICDKCRHDLRSLTGWILCIEMP